MLQMGLDFEPSRGVVRSLTRMRKPTHLALAAIVLWSSLAVLSVSLVRVPPFLLIGLSLSLGGLVSVPRAREWRVPGRTLLLGCAGIFGYHFCLFMALRRAPPVEANLINYLWPLLMVILSPVFLPGTRLSLHHVLGGVLGLGGAALLVLGGHRTVPSTANLAGYGLALAAAFLWASYSLLCSRVARFPTAAVGAFCLLSGLLSLLVHEGLEVAYSPTRAEWGGIVLLGLGPLGAAFFLWDAALKRGDPRSIGTLAYLTPLLSTGLLAAFGPGRLGWRVAVALALILAGAWLGNRTPSTAGDDPGANRAR